MILNVSLRNLAAGAAGGTAGALAINAMMTAHAKLTPAAVPPIKQDPGEFMTLKAEEWLPRKVRHALPRSAEKITAKTLAIGYGVAFSTLYALVRPRASSAARRLGEGTALGVATWAVGYLGWLPAVGLMPPIWKQRPLQIIAPVVHHIVYGLAAVTVVDAIRE